MLLRGIRLNLGGAFRDTGRQAVQATCGIAIFLDLFGKFLVYVMIFRFAFCFSRNYPVFFSSTQQANVRIFSIPSMVGGWGHVCIAFVSMEQFGRHHMFHHWNELSYAKNPLFSRFTTKPGCFVYREPGGSKIFNWAGTSWWEARIQFKTPMLFCIGFLFQVLIAGPQRGSMIGFRRPSIGPGFRRLLTLFVVGANFSWM